ncbi:hypothetical protein GSUB_05525 [Geoalkalibacter subterraneus]|uniref:Uncharacterized protein n=2 Tax=Geoalkalibacter subterraneus TaxID=483547 RepID=A0A0B5FFP7_9BACT|nr:hypothetical protein GSUB_05525 [Geoalkalibacter subterraneus]
MPLFENDYHDISARAWVAIVLKTIFKESVFTVILFELGIFLNILNKSLSDRREKSKGKLAKTYIPVTLNLVP